MKVLDEHITFIEKHYKKTLDHICANVGWVGDENSILSKIYEAHEFVETWVDEDGEVGHRVFKMS